MILTVLIGFAVTIVALALLALWLVYRWLNRNADMWDKPEQNL